MADFVDLLRENRNYRCTWMGQVVSEIGDYFNNIAVFSLVMQTSGSGLVVSGVMLSRAIPAVLAGGGSSGGCMSKQSFAGDCLFSALHGMREW